LAARVQIVAHDASSKLFLGYDKIGKVVIGDNVFIGQNTIILPNVTIVNRVIIGAGSVVTRDIPSNSVAAGNPARVKCMLDEYMEKISNW
jgi:maltose O-acetyltransferase